MRVCPRACAPRYFKTNIIKKLIDILWLLVSDFSHISTKKLLQKKQVRYGQLASPPAVSSTRVCGGHFRTPIASLITNVISTKRH